jgi:hypothetical protein
MAIDFGALPGVLTNPTATFSKLREGANIVDGIKLLIIVMAIAMSVSLVVQLALMATTTYMGQSMLSIAGSTFFVVFLIGIALGIAIGIAAFLFVSWMITKLTASIGGKPSDFGRTCGLLAYSGAAFYLFLMLPLSVVQTALMWGTQTQMMSNPHASVSSMAGMMGVQMIFGAISFAIAIWALLIEGRAASIANNTTWGAGIAGVFLTWVILFVIALIIIFAVVAVMFSTMSYQSYSYSPSGYAFWGLF